MAILEKFRKGKEDEKEEEEISEEEEESGVEDEESGDEEENVSNDEESGGEDDMEVEEEQDEEAQDDGEEVQEDQKVPEAAPQQREKSILDVYKLLGNAKNMKSRIEASSKLLKYISGKTSEYKYMLKRLLLGLASPSESSRQSHFVCLVEFLRQNQIANSEVQEAMQTYLKASGKSEEGLFMLGQLLAQNAVLRSGITLTKKEKMQVLQDLCSNGSNKTYLWLATFNVIVEFFVSDESLDTDKLLTTVGEAFELNITEATLDTLYLICSVLNKSNANKETLFKHFGFKKVGKENFIENAVKAISNTSLPIENVISHPALKELAVKLITQKVKGKFLSSVIPELKSSNYKNQIAVALVHEIFTQSPEIDVLSKDVLEMVITLSEKGHGEIMLPLIEMLDSRIKSDKDFASALLPRLLDSCVCWDKFAPGSLVNDIIAKGDKDLIFSASKIFMDKFCSDSKTNDRVFSANMLAKIVGNPAVVEEIDWRVGILSSLFEHTISGLQASNDSFPQLARDARFQLKEVFYRGLDANCKTLTDSVKLVHACMTRAVQLSNDGDCFKDESKKSWKKMTAVVSSLHKDWSKNQDKESGMFLLLFCHIGLQLFSQPDMAIDVLSELVPLHSNWSKGKSSKGAGPSGFEIVIEIMLSLLAQNKHILRNLVQTIFKLISSQLTKTAMQSLLDVIKGEIGDENEESDEEMDEDEDAEESDEDENDVEDQEDEEESDVEPSDSEEEDDDKEDDEKNLDESTMKKIESALGEHGDVDEESDIDMDDIPDEEMKKLDEKLVEAFKALGGKKSFREKKKERLDHLAQQHFQLRVLDLIEIYIQQKPSVENICIILPAILESYQKLYTNKKEATLCNKMKTVLARCAHLKLEPDTDIDTSKLLEYLVRLSCNTALNAMGLLQVVSRLCVLALRMCLASQETAANKLYLDSLKNYYENKGGFVSHELFVGAVSVAWSGAHAVVKEVLEKTFGSEVRHYQRTQGLSILRSYLQNKKLSETFPEEYKKHSKIITKKVIMNLNEYIEKSKPNQITELFDILKVCKQQNVLDQQELEQAKASLEKFATSNSKLLNINKVKKSLKKILSFYGMRVQIQTNKQHGVTAKTEQNGDGGQQLNEEEGAKKKKKKKNKGKKKKENRLEEGEENGDSAPSFKRCLIDTTKVYVNTEKKKGKKRKNKNKDEEKEESTPQPMDTDVSPKKKKSKKSHNSAEKQTEPVAPAPVKSKKMKKEKV